MSTNTFAESPPRRPTIDDVGGGQKVNDSIDRPDPARDATAEDFNQLSQQVVGLARTTPHTRVTYRYNGSSYQVTRVASLVPAIDLLTAQTLLVPMINTAGDVSIFWPQATFPTPVADHGARPTGSTATTLACETLALAGGNLGVRVRMGAGHGHFVLEIF